MVSVTTMCVWAWVLCVCVGVTNATPVPVPRQTLSHVEGNSYAQQILVTMESPNTIIVRFQSVAIANYNVKFGANVTSLPFMANTSAPNNYEYIRSDGYKYNSHYIYSSYISQIPVSKFFHYQITSSDLNFESPIYSCRIPLVAGNPGVSIAIVGDLGQTDDSRKTVDHIINGSQEDSSYQALIIAGDLSYADSEKTKCDHPGGCNQSRWDYFGEMLEPLATQLPVMTLPGNHEVEQEKTNPQVPFLAFQHRYNKRVGAPLYYSWDIGLLHCIFLNSYEEHVDPNWNTANSRQYQWLQADLEANRHSATEWIAVFMHAPWYNSDKAHQNEIEPTQLKILMEDLLNEYKVDMIFAGHVHAYERTYPVKHGVVTPGAPVEINVGDGGNREGPAADYLPQPKWSAFRFPVFGHGGLQIVNTSHVQFTWHRNDQEESQVADQVWLVKNQALQNSLAHGVTVFKSTGKTGEHLGDAWNEQLRSDLRK